MASRIDDPRGDLQEGERDAPEGSPGDAPESCPPAALAAAPSSGRPPASFRTAYARYAGFVLRILERWMGKWNRSPESAKDVRQNVFLILASLMARQVIENVRGMLVKIAWREACHHVRAQLPTADGGASAEAAPASARNPEQCAMATESAEIVDDVFSRMTPGAADVMRRADIEGETCAEIAEEQGRDASTVTSQLSRARKRFAELAREHHGEPPRRPPPTPPPRELHRKRSRARGNRSRSVRARPPRSRA